ncbi:MAG: SelB C-terminal domain-containing protein, partial [Gemmatimonadota bacterium]|nr:SelB C-terminal domain-containing protein [Gemmatimonadota bacterium]
LAILNLLGVQSGVIALTKADLVDDEWLDLVREDVRVATRGTPLATAEVIATSILAVDGLNALRHAIGRAARALPERAPRDLFRLPVDRAFTVRGTGTVVTGTVWSGTLEREAGVRLFPGGLVARVRGIESHGRAVTSARPGTRAAIALANVEVSGVRRGTVLVDGDGWEETEALLAEVVLLEGAGQQLGPRTRVRFHLGTSDVGARIVCAGGSLQPGERREARLVLDEPLVARAGDRFVIRSASPILTIGGGIVGDPAPARRRARPRTASPQTPADRLRAMLAADGIRGVTLAALPVRTGVRPDELAALLAAVASEVVRVGERLYAGSAFAEVERQVEELVAAYHERNPLELGVSLQSVRARIGAGGAVADRVLHRLAEAGYLEIDGSLVRRRGWVPALTPAQERHRTELIDALERAAREPPSVGELEVTHGPQTSALLRLLERAELIVQVEPDRYYLRRVVEALVGVLRTGMVPGREYTPPELRELLGFSRKYLIPFLEFCDRLGVTERRAGGRVIRMA